MTRQAADDLRELLAVYAEPILRERGWKGSGRRFTRSNEVGDVALVRFAPWQLPDVVSFNVELAVVPALWARWRTSADLRGSGGLTEADGLWRSRLDPPPAPDDDCPSWWQYDASTRAGTGQALRERLMAAAAMMDLLLDPVRAVKLLRGMSEREYDASGFQPNPALAVATYLVVGGSLDEARVAVDELAAAWAASPATDDEAVRFMQAALAERNA